MRYGWVCGEGEGSGQRRRRCPNVRKNGRHKLGGNVALCACSARNAIHVASARIKSTRIFFLGRLDLKNERNERIYGARSRTQCSSAGAILSERRGGKKKSRDLSSVTSL